MYVIVHCSSLARYVSEGCNADEQRVLGDELAFTLKWGRRLIIVCSVEDVSLSQLRYLQQLV